MELSSSTKQVSKHKLELTLRDLLDLLTLAQAHKREDLPIIYDGDQVHVETVLSKHQLAMPELDETLLVLHVKQEEVLQEEEGK